jgi:deaminated glutathione amidase
MLQACPTYPMYIFTPCTARAIESQCYVIAAAQSGKHNEKRESYGHALVVDPWGTVVVDAGGVDSKGMDDSMKIGYDGSEEEECFSNRVVMCDIDMEPLASIRQRMPVQQHRSIAMFQ